MRSGPPTPNVFYRETIRFSAEGERKYIRYEVQMKMDVPVQLVGKIRLLGLRVARQFPLPSEKRYRPLLRSEAGDTYPGDLGEWT